MLSLVSLMAAAWSMAAFTNEDLAKMVNELERHVPRHSEYAYPIKSSVVTDPRINAYATVEDGANDTLVPVMVVYTGLVEFFKGEERLIRAVVAHELAHLSKGHPTSGGFSVGEVNSLFIRQMELEADAIAASILVASGYAKQDMIDVLMKLDELGKDTPLMHNIGADHPTGASRAAVVADNPMVYRSMAEFQLGNGFMENRNYPQAKEAFRRALAREPKLTEAAVNLGQASLMDYYDKLPQLMKQQWFRPDFGPVISETPIGSRAIVVDAADLRRYQEAMTDINAALAKAPNNLRAQELRFLALVLDPEQTPANLQEGIAGFRSLMAKEATEADKLRYANNLAIGLQRTNQLVEAVKAMVSASEASTLYSAYLAMNMGLKGMEHITESDAEVAVSMIQTWLSNTPSIHRDYPTMKAAYTAACTKFGYVAKDITPFPIFLCQATTLTFKDGKEISLFEPPRKANDLFGIADIAYTFTDMYPDLREICWNDKRFNMVVDKDIIYRVTTYEEGSGIQLRPMDDTIDGVWNIRVGMTKADVEKILNLGAAMKKPFVRSGQVEEWTYFPSLMLGILFDGDKVAGVTVSPYDQQMLD